MEIFRLDSSLTVFFSPRDYTIIRNVFEYSRVYFACMWLWKPYEQLLLYILPHSWIYNINRVPNVPSFVRNVPFTTDSILPSSFLIQDFPFAQNFYLQSGYSRTFHFVETTKIYRIRPECANITSTSLTCFHTFNSIQNWWLFSVFTISIERNSENTIHSVKPTTFEYDW